MSDRSGLRELRSGAELSDRYRLQRRLGRGGEAETWLASDRMTGAAVALKIQNVPDANRGMLHREWQTSIRLIHPHIARAFEFHDDAAGAFYSLQYIEGPGAGVLAGAAPSAVLPVIAAIADALRYAHGKGIVHRDVKADNVLLDANGAPYLIDFGVAAAAGQAAAGGSPIAASPEQLDGAPAATADDVFALGGLAYELLTGRAPYSGSDLAEAIRTEVPPPVAAANGEPIPEAVTAIVAAMLAKDAAARPSAADVVDALSAAGFRPGVAPAELVARPADRGVETVESRAASPRKAATISTTPSAPPERRGGIQPLAVYGSLAVLLLLLLGVVFYLPNRVADAPLEESGEASAVQTEQEPVATPETPDESEAAPPSRDVRVEARQATEVVLGRLLSMMQTLEARAVQRWGGLRYSQGKAAYETGDQAFLDRDYELAAAEYEKAIGLLEPLLDEVNAVFADTLSTGIAALAEGDSTAALEAFDLAVAISPSDREAQEGLTRARNLDQVLSLVAAGERYEANLEFDLALEAFDRAKAIDPLWQEASDGIARVRAAAIQMEFDTRMSEGLAALAVEDYATARAAFSRAEALRPGSSEPRDGLLQVDQGVRLGRIRSLEQEAATIASSERWEDAASTYEAILELDPDLAFAQQGLAHANRMANIHKQFDRYIAAPDSLSAPATMQRATNLIVSVTRLPVVGPRLEGQRDELSRLLKRAATPLTVELVSDNVTEVSIHKVGQLGSFSSRQLELRPGTYVAVGSRPGYRDVRVEFRVAPEVEMQPVVVRSEEPI